MAGTKSTKNRSIFIYALIDPRTQAVRYIGRSHNPIRRLSSHICRSKTGRDDEPKGLWVLELLGIGLRPRIASIEMCTEADWPERERYWIRWFRDREPLLTNVFAGGDRAPELPDATRAKMGAKKLGNHYSRGHSVSAESRSRISTASKAHWDRMTTEERDATSERTRAWVEARRQSGGHVGSVKGWRHTAEARAKISAAGMGHQRNLGVKFSDVARANIAAAVRRRWAAMSTDQRAEIGRKGNATRRRMHSGGGGDTQVPERPNEQ